MSQKKLTNSTSIRSYLEQVIQESLTDAKSKMRQKSLDEKDKQQNTATSQGGEESLDDILGSDDEPSEQTDDSGEEQSSSEEPEKKPVDNEKQQHDKEAMEKAEVTHDDVIEKLNIIRSGRSLKDSAIKGAMEKYVNDLEPAEKTALFAFLKGISQIITGEIPGESATEPSENPASVDMKKTTGGDSANSQGQNKKSIKPNIIKSPGAKTNQPSQKPMGGEDTSGPVIVPKRR